MKLIQIIHLIFIKIKDCLFSSKKVKFTKSQLMFQKELEIVKKQIEEVKARSKEDNEMNDEVNGNVAEELSVEPKDLAYSIVQDPKTKMWQAVELKFDLGAGVLGGVKVIEQNLNKQIINERFHVLIGRNLL